MRTTTPITIRYGETDMMGVVYHANYLLYFEDARTQFLQELGYPYELLEEAGLMSPVLDAQLSYGMPLRYGKGAFVVTRVVSSKPMRTTFAYEVYEEGAVPGVDKPACTGTTVHCLVERSTFKPVSIKREVPALYELYNQALEAE